MSITKKVSEFSVASKCVMGDPCLHQCVIKLFDGRVWQADLKGSDVFCFIKSLPKSTKVKNIWGSDHFEKYGKLCDGPTTTKIEQILLQHFKH
jgi:hypothetical protein